MLRENLIHGDLHAGNVMVRPDGSVALIDAGLVVELPPVARANFWILFDALLRRDGRKAAQEMLRRGGFVPGATDAAGFEDDLDAIFGELSGLTQSEQLARALWLVLRSARQRRVRLDGSFVTLVTSCVVLEGTGRQLDPQLSVLSMAAQLTKERLAFAKS